MTELKKREGELGIGVYVNPWRVLKPENIKAIGEKEVNNTHYIENRKKQDSRNTDELYLSVPICVHLWLTLFVCFRVIRGQFYLCSSMSKPFRVFRVIRG
jgi:hypothetical protein